MNDRITTPSPFSYGMAYMRARETGVFSFEPSTTPIVKKAVTVGEPPQLAPEIRAKLLGEADIPEQPTPQTPMSTPEVSAEPVEQTETPEPRTTQEPLWNRFERYLKSKRKFRKVMGPNGRWLHKNSKVRDESANQARMQKVLDVFRREKRPMTDREVAISLNFQDMNAVRPSITLAIKRGLLEEVDDVIDELTKYEVRRCQPTAEGLVT